VATHLVNEGKLLKAQARLGHRDPSTTLRPYSHATALDDQDVADDLDALLHLHNTAENGQLFRTIPDTQYGPIRTGGRLKADTPK
jgi:hypothetical protein